MGRTHVWLFVMVNEAAVPLALPTSVEIRPCCVPSTHVMRLRSGKNTQPNLSHRSFPTVYLKSSYPYPHVSNKSQRGWKRHFHPRWKLLHKIRGSLQYDLNVKCRIGPYSGPISSRFQSPIPEHIRTVLIDLHLPFYEPTSNGRDAEPDVELTTS
jgi:hypothetical protein